MSIVREELLERVAVNIRTFDSRKGKWGLVD